MSGDLQAELAPSPSTAASTRTSCCSRLRCEVADMFPYKTYILFTYSRLADVRIVYAPPSGLASFGGDKDNFEWSHPARHHQRPRPPTVPSLRTPPVSLTRYSHCAPCNRRPRYAADFALLRAYTAPGGRAAAYAQENVPYVPARPLRVSAAGAHEVRLHSMRRAAATAVLILRRAGLLREDLVFGTLSTRLAGRRRLLARLPRFHDALCAARGHSGPTSR
jgi:hypothetical protein